MTDIYATKLTSEVPYSHYENALRFHIHIVLLVKRKKKKLPPMLPDI